MKVRKRIQKTQKIQLPLFSENKAYSYYDFYDEQYKTEDYDDGFDGLGYEELEELGVIEINKATKIIDGETAAFSAVKSGEDW